MEIRNLKELVALMKLLKFVKFENSDFELSFFAGSPILSEIFKKISEEVKNHNGKEKEFDWGYIEDENGYIEIIKERVKKIPDWNIINISQKIELIKVFIHPYKCNKFTMNELCNI